MALDHAYDNEAAAGLQYAPNSSEELAHGGPARGVIARVERVDQPLIETDIDGAIWDAAEHERIFDGKVERAVNRSCALRPAAFRHAPFAVVDGQNAQSLTLPPALCERLRHLAGAAPEIHDKELPRAVAAFDRCNDDIARSGNQNPGSKMQK